jgi:hypothetical protein
LHTNCLCHVGLGVHSSEQKDNLPLACQTCSNGSRPLPPFQGLALFWG